MFSYDDYNALPEIFTGFFFLIVITTISLLTFFVQHVDTVPHLVNLLANSFLSNVSVQDYNLQFQYLPKYQ